MLRRGGLVVCIGERWSSGSCWGEVVELFVLRRGSLVVCVGERWSSCLCWREWSSCLC